MSNRKPREVPLKVAAARAVLLYIAKRGRKIAARKGLWETLWQLLWDGAGIATLSWAGFQIHSALGGAIAGLGCFLMAQKFRPSKGASL